MLARIISGAQLDEFFSTDKLPVARYPQAVAVSLAMRASWRRENLFELVKALGIRVSPKELGRVDDGNGHRPTRGPENRKRARRPSKGKKATHH